MQGILFIKNIEKSSVLFVFIDLGRFLPGRKLFGDVLQPAVLFPVSQYAFAEHRLRGREGGIGVGVVQDHAGRRGKGPLPLKRRSGSQVDFTHFSTLLLSDFVGGGVGLADDAQKIAHLCRVADHFDPGVFGVELHFRHITHREDHAVRIQADFSAFLREDDARGGDLLQGGGDAHRDSVIADDLPQHIGVGGAEAGDLQDVVLHLHDDGLLSFQG